MRVAILCGGKGTRLGQPIKCLAEIAGRPFLDWKIEQVEWAGGTEILLIAGPYHQELRRRYGARVHDVRPDPQTGIPQALHTFGHCWWTWGDTLCAVPLWVATRNVMLVTRHTGGNIAGIYTDVGYYYGKKEHHLIETKHRPYHINDRENLEVTDARVRRYGITR